MNLRLALQSNLQVADSETVEEAMGLEAVGWDSEVGLEEEEEAAVLVAEEEKGGWEEAQLDKPRSDPQWCQLGPRYKSPRRNKHPKLPN